MNTCSVISRNLALTLNIVNLEKKAKSQKATKKKKAKIVVSNRSGLTLNNKRKNNLYQFSDDVSDPSMLAVELLTHVVPLFLLIYNLVQELIIIMK